jgi:hypothetical protein
MFISREDVREEMIRFGVSPEEVSARLGSLSDEEVLHLSKTIRDMPAGGDALGTVVVAILVVFFVLLFTDIMGLTKVYPFTRPVR